jgi:hypothetical protein
MKNPHIVRKLVDPTTAPPEEGIHWINTVSGMEFFSIGTNSLSDWVARVSGAQSPASSVTDEAAYGIAPIVGTSLHYARQDHTHGTVAAPTKATVGLPSVDDTSDADKPISILTAAAITNLVEKNTTIVGDTKLKITYDSKGLVTSGDDALLNDLSNVTVGTPTINDILQYNGVGWVNTPIVVPVSAGAGINLYLTSTSSGISGYNFMYTIPDVGSEVDIFATANNNTVLIASYVSDGGGGLGGNSIEAGIWRFNISCYVSSAANTSYLMVRTYSRTVGGVETLLFEKQTQELDNSTVALSLITTAQPSFVIDPTDTLVVKFYGVTNSTSDKDIHLVHSGTTNYTFISTPFVTRHNDLVGIQGGSATERYHLTQAQALVVQNTSGTNTGDDPIVTSIASASSAVVTSHTIAPVVMGGMSISPLAGQHIVQLNAQYSSVATSITSQVASDLASTVSDLNALTQTATHIPTFGTETIFAGVYDITGAATQTASTTLTLDAQLNSSAIFVFRFSGAFGIGASVTVNLINGANANNVFFRVNGAVTTGTNIVYKGTLIVVSAALDLAAGCSLEGRAASTIGAITLGTTTITKPSVASVINMQTFANFALFNTSGANTNTGISNITGDIGTNLGANTGFGTSTVNGSFYTSTSISSLLTFGIYVDGILNSHSERVATRDLALSSAILSLYEVITITTGQIIDVRISVQFGSVTVGNRILTSLRIS